MTNHDVYVVLDNLYERMEIGDLKTKVTSKERSAVYKAIGLVQQAEVEERRTKNK